ncbi:beta-ketoacyl synthase N-terminal-like domain-containing protein [Micromonospora arborensis]|uniref:type I polyketide synthase n=1 Tax=Micromonospora arborensis TaxID=2116518 RepID=UPI0034473EAC
MSVSADHAQPSGRHHEPIAVIGMSCRLPGASGPDALWRLLRHKRSAVGAIPTERLGADYRTSDRPVPIDAVRGAFLDDVTSFDAPFFGMSPDEAEATDPQQRLALELAWEALEDARILPARLHRTRVGVYVGAAAYDYTILAAGRDVSSVARDPRTGPQRQPVAQRISNLLALTGPSLTFDFAQSSSLAAVHLGQASLCRGETAMVLVGAVALNLAADLPWLAREPDEPPLSRQTAALDRDGFAPGEGGGMLLLKPLHRALADGDPVRAVILGTALNTGRRGRHDPAAQVEVLRSAGAAAGIDPADVGYVELSAAGVAAIDQVEAASLAAAYHPNGPGRRPLRVGSVKTNIGHLDGAAGVAGLLKTVLCVEHGRLPGSPDLEAWQPADAFAEWNLRLQNDDEAWPHGSSRRIAGVSDFGVGGSNCHLILGSCPPRTSVTSAGAAGHTDNGSFSRVGEAPSPGSVWLLSGLDREALAAQATQLAGHVAQHPQLAIDDIGFSLAATRTTFTHRAALMVTDRTSAIAGLQALAEGTPDATAVLGAGTRPARPVFVFPGQGPQWPRMGAVLMDESSEFAASIKECAEAFAPYIKRDLVEVFRHESLLGDSGPADVIQPALFAMMVGLSRLWREHGVEPAAVVGHSLGATAAAYVSGAVSLPEAVRIMAVRARLVRRLAGLGGMLVVDAAVDTLAEELRLADGLVRVAAVNGPRSTVVSGPSAELAAFVQRMTSIGVRARRIPVDYASHSSAVEALREELVDTLADLRPVPSQIPFYSTLTGAAFATDGLDASYWYRNERERVSFEPALRAALHDRHEVFIEVSPHPVLTATVQDIAQDAGYQVETIPTLRRGDGGLSRFHRSLATAHVHGIHVTWSKLWRDRAVQAVPLPSYPFQRRRHWITSGVVAPYRDTQLVPGSVPPTRPAMTDAVPVSPPSAPPAAAAKPARAEQRHRAQRLVTDAVRAVLQHQDSHPIPSNHTFSELGIDSHLAVELTQRIAAALGVPVPVAAVFDHPTCAQLAAHLQELPQLGGDPSDTGVTATRALPAASVPPPPSTARPLANRDHVAPAHPPTSFPVPMDEPIAVIGLACRLPSADDPAAFWSLLREGRQTVGPMPASRRMRVPEPLGNTPVASYLSGDIAEFDPLFFNISPREAQEMDPQQRLFLEVAWEALEDAGLANEALQGTRAGVFAGVTWRDWAELRAISGRGPSAHSATGAAVNMVANRLSYVLGLRGPSMTVDTACSSSLMAVHLACQSLRSREATVAVAGGVNLLVNPGTTAGLIEFGGLSPEGRSRAFDADADGYGRGEGCAVVVLKPLSHALRDGDHVWCTIRGSAANNDGLSNGLTAPSQAAQEQVLREAYRRAGVAPRDVGYVETHGTGTVLGDYIEASALGAVFGGDRPGTPLILGAVKTNIGHLEAAAGVTGLVKAALLLTHGEVPGNLNYRRPNPRIDLDRLGLRVPAGQEPWPEGRPLLAGVSSFGWGGTNVHVVVEGAPNTWTTDEAAGGDGPADGNSGARREPERVALFTLSARTAQALRQFAVRMADRLDAVPPSVTVPDVAAVAARRAAQPYRLAVVGETIAELAAALRGFAAGRAPAALHSSPAEVQEPPQVACVLPGEQLLRSRLDELLAEPVFATQIGEYDEMLAPLRNRSVSAELTGAITDPTARLSPYAVLGLQVSLMALWRSQGVEPDLVLGNGIGEIVASHLQGGSALSSVLSSAVADLRARVERDDRAFAGLSDDSAPVSLPARGRWAVVRLAGEPAPPVADARPQRGEVAAVTVWYRPGHRAELDLIGQLFVAGVSVTRTVTGARQHVALPSYPWQREPYWGLPSPVAGTSSVPTLRDRAVPEAGEQQEVRLGAAAASASTLMPSGGAAAPEDIEPAAADESSPRLDDLEVLVRGVVAEVVGLDPDRIGQQTPVRSFGITSLMSLDVANRLQARLGLRLSATLVWNYPTVEAIAGHLLSRLDVGASARTVEPEVTAPAPAVGAITGHQPNVGVPDPGDGPGGSESLEDQLAKELAELIAQMETME